MKSPCLIGNTSSKGPFAIAMLDYRSVFPGAVSKICPNLWPSKNCPGNSTIKFCPGGQNGNSKIAFHEILVASSLAESWSVYKWLLSNNIKMACFSITLYKYMTYKQMTGTSFGPIINPSPDPPEQRSKPLADMNHEILVGSWGSFNITHIRSMYAIFTYMWLIFMVFM